MIQMMENQRISEYGEITKDFRRQERESIFFFLYEGPSVKAFGMLKPVSLFYENEKYQIMGVANVIAIEKSSGYGSQLMRQISQYLKDHHMVGLGNTHRDNFVFYQKCGYTFVPGLLERFVYINQDGQEQRTETDDYCMFVFDQHNTLHQIINGADPVIIKVPFW